MASPTGQPPFFTLPYELRAAIYVYATCNFQAPMRDRSRRKRNIGILQTCRQMREEAFESYYSNTTFRGECGDCIEWLSTLSARTRFFLRRILINFTVGPTTQLSFTKLSAHIAEVRRIPDLRPDCTIEAHFVSLPGTDDFR